MQELSYCQDPQCKLPLKIVKSLEEYLESNHNGHKIRKVSQLRDDILTENSKFLNKTSKDDLYRYIDTLVEPINKLFSMKLTQKLKLFVDENFILSNDFQQLLSAILNNNQNDILKYSAQLDFILNYDKENFKQQNMVNEEIKQKLDQSIQLTSVHVQELDDINLRLDMGQNQFNLEDDNNKTKSQLILQIQKNKIEVDGLVDQMLNENMQLQEAKNNLSSQLQTFQKVQIHQEQQTSQELKQELQQIQSSISQEKKQLLFTQTDLSQSLKQFDQKSDRKKTSQYQNEQISFEWSDICISKYIKIFGKTTQSLLEFYTPRFIYMKQKMDYKEIKSLQLKLHSCCMIHICDLNILKVKCPGFVKTYSLGFGAYSHRYNGCNY